MIKLYYEAQWWTCSGLEPHKNDAFKLKRFSFLFLLDKSSFLIVGMQFLSGRLCIKAVLVSAAAPEEVPNRP